MILARGATRRAACHKGGIYGWQDGYLLAHAKGRRAKRILLRFDLGAIYFFIAGS